MLADVKTTAKSEEKGDIRKTAHTWAASTAAMVVLLCRWSLYLKGCCQSSALEFFHSFINHLSNDHTMAFVFFAEEKIENMPEKAHSLQYIENLKYKSFNIQRGLVTTEDLMKFVPRGSNLFDLVHCFFR